MFPFDKKEKNEEIEVDENLDRKSIRDLKPENRRSRKEPLKPWGREERMLVLVVLIATVGLSLVFGLVANGKFEFSLPKVDKISLPSFEQKFVFEKENSNEEILSEETDKNFDQVIDSFKEKTSSLSGTYGFYVIEVDNKSELRSYGLDQDVTFKAASLIKLPVAISVYKEVEKGNLNLDDKHKLLNKEKVEGNGVVIGMGEGTMISYRDLMKHMIIDSDNTAFNIFENYLGDRKIQEYTKGMGLLKTSVIDNTTTPSDMANLLDKLVRGKLILDENTEELISFLKVARFENWIEAGVPKEIEVAHKYGNMPRVVNDAGIVFTDNPYVVVIMSKDVSESEANLVFPTLSKIIYDFEVE